MSKEFEVAVIISAKFVALLFVPNNEANSCRPQVEGRSQHCSSYWVVTQNTDSINREYKNLFHDIKLTLMWRGLCVKAFG
jgi:hypothetical protein